MLLFSISDSFAMFCLVTASLAFFVDFEGTSCFRVVLVCFGHRTK